MEAKGEALNYLGDYSLCCPIKPEEAKATYKEGLLKIRPPYGDALKDTVDVEIIQTHSFLIIVLVPRYIYTKGTSLLAPN